MKAKVELHGGPLDGEESYRTIVDQPGKFPLLVHKEASGRRYVYQARRFAEDDSNSVLVMDFVQILMGADDI